MMKRMMRTEASLENVARQPKNFKKIITIKNHREEIAPESYRAENACLPTFGVFDIDSFIIQINACYAEHIHSKEEICASQVLGQLKADGFLFCIQVIGDRNEVAHDGHDPDDPQK